MVVLSRPDMVGGALTLLRSQFEKQLRPGCRFVSLLFAVPTWSTLEQQQEMQLRLQLRRDSDRENVRDTGAAAAAAAAESRGRAPSRRTSAGPRSASASRSRATSASASASRSRSRSRADSSDEPSQHVVSESKFAVPVRPSRSPSPAVRSLSRRERDRERERDKPRRGLFIYVMGQHTVNSSNNSSNLSTRSSSAGREHTSESKDSRQHIETALAATSSESEVPAAAIGANSALPPRARRPASAAVASRTKPKLTELLEAANAAVPSGRDSDRTHLSQTLRWIEELLARATSLDTVN